MAAGPVSTCSVRFADLDRTVIAAIGSTLLEACDGGGVTMDSACGGFAACNSCRVRLVEGVLSPLDDAEEPFLDAPGQRLGCQARVVGDVVLVMDPGC